MKNIFPWDKTLFSILFFLMACMTNAQQQFIVISNKTNNSCNSTCTLLDNSEINSNPSAVIFITPVEVNGVNLDPHPICAYYNGKQWSVMNTDNATMPTGAQFTVQYFLKADDNHFIHIVTRENLIKANSYIDNPLLNGNPKAQFQYFQSAAPNVRGGLVNKNEVQIKYDEGEGKWFIAKTKGNPLDLSTGYSISIKSPLNIVTRKTTPVPVTTANANLRSMNGVGDDVFITVTGNQQGQFIGTYEMNRIELTNLEMGINAALDLNSGLANGKRHYSPILFQKKTDASSIQFFKAVTSNEKLTTVTFDIYKKSSGSTASLDYSITLNNAVISSFKQVYSQVAGGNKMDSVSIIFQSITYSSGTTIVSDSQSQN